MNYIEQIKGFWLAQEMNQLGTSEIAMYFHFLEIWNKTGWIGSFYRNNYKVMADLSIRSPKTLQSVKDKLQQAGILTFKQKNGDANCQYIMNNLGNFYRGKVKGSGEVGAEVREEVRERLVQSKDKLKRNQTKPNILSPSGKPTTPEKKKTERKESRAFWEKFVEVFDGFYKSKNNNNAYAYLGKDFDNLGRIYDFLKSRAEAKNFEWTETNATNGFKNYLERAYQKDEWLRNNFSIGKLLSQFNEIANGQQSATKNGKPATGGSVDTASAFSAIDRHFG